MNSICIKCKKGFLEQELKPEGICKRCWEQEKMEEYLTFHHVDVLPSASIPVKEEDHTYKLCNYMFEQKPRTR